MFGPHSRSRAAGRVAGVVLAVGLLASACGGTASTTASSVASAAGSVASVAGSAADAAGSKLSSAAAKATSAAGSAASAAASKVSSAVSSVKGSGAATGPAEVNTATTSLGVVLVGANGMTLYVYDPDTGGTPTCYDACATAWPPLVTSGAPTAAGQAEANLLTTAARTDGTTQVVYNKWPLYLWQKDTKPGDVTGQAVGGKWWVVGPDGTPIKTPAG
jgi:predicted lipoprotein with Yx(FWY)xxD motif